MANNKESRDERMARYNRERREAIDRIEKLANGRTLPLSEVAPFLPVVPEWEVYGG